MRKKKKHEEYLESKEPVSVVILNNISYLMEDLGEILLDISKLKTKRPEEFQKLMQALKLGPNGFFSDLPENVSNQARASLTALMLISSSVKKSAGSEPAGKTPFGIDPAKLPSESLEEAGMAFKKEAEKILKSIEEYEKTLLRNKK